MRVIFSIFLALISVSSFAWTQRPPLPVEQCTVHVPYGFPETDRVGGICRQAYFVGYDAAAQLPRYVTYSLRPENALGCFPRTNAFVEDASIKDGPEPEDYTGTGFDKGHAAPDGDMSWDQQVEYESFLMTNMFPQAGSLNRGIWKLLETSIRGWAVQRGQSYTIYVGAVYNNNNPRIGDGVIVPHAYYKIVINDYTREVAGWLFPHVAPYPNLGNDLTKFRTPIAQIQQAAGVTFGFPAGAQELQPGKEWTVDFGALTTAKRTKCKN